MREITLNYFKLLVQHNPRTFKLHDYTVGPKIRYSSHYFLDFLVLVLHLSNYRYSSKQMLPSSAVRNIAIAARSHLNNPKKW